jgi:hypothetical protein
VRLNTAPLVTLTMSTLYDKSEINSNNHDTLVLKHKIIVMLWNFKKPITVFLNFSLTSTLGSSQTFRDFPGEWSPCHMGVLLHFNKMQSANHCNSVHYMFISCTVTKCMPSRCYNSQQNAVCKMWWSQLLLVECGIMT